MPGKIMSKHYRITTYADDLDGSLHARVDFTDPMGESGEDERIVYAATENAKRYIRNELKARESAPLARTYYEITANKIDHIGYLRSITIGEKI
jgi:hypothetical protein